MVDDKERNEFILKEHYEIPDLFAYERGRMMTTFSVSSFGRSVQPPEKVTRALPMALVMKAANVVPVRLWSAVSTRTGRHSRGA